MNYEIEATPEFLRSSKQLKKKYRSLPSDLDNLIQQLITEPRTGVHLGDNLYKIRLAIKSKQRGKSGGARVITAVVDATESILLVQLYDKSEIDSVLREELRTIVSAYLDSRD